MGTADRFASTAVKRKIVPFAARECSNTGRSSATRGEVRVLVMGRPASWLVLVQHACRAFDNAGRHKSMWFEKRA